MNKIINDFIFQKYDNCYPLFSFNEDEFKFGDFNFSSDSGIDDYSQLVNISLKNVIDSEVDNNHIFLYLYHNLENIITNDDANKQNVYYIIERCYGFFENNYIVETSVNITIDLKIIILQCIFNYLRAFPVTFAAYLLTLSKDEIEQIYSLIDKIEKSKVYSPQLLYKAILQISLNNQNYVEILTNLILQPLSVILKFIQSFSNNTTLFNNYLQTLFKYLSFNEEMLYLSKDEVSVLIQLQNKNIVNIQNISMLLTEDIIEQLPHTLMETCLNSFAKPKK